MDLKELQKNWNQFGEQDPLWAILVDEKKKGGKWDIEEFFKTGREEIAAVLDWVNSLGIPLRRGRALDFGCGVGRLTQALALYFEMCFGIDIAPSMINLAKNYNHFEDKCKYYLNSADNLSLFENNYFDFIYSNIVLQHMEPRYSQEYIAEFIRVLSPGGVAVFQVPSEPAVHGSALPDSAFKAQITPLNTDITLKSCSRISIPVRIKNISNTPWPHLNGVLPIRLGNHWLSEDGIKIRNDDGRASLPADLKPEGEVELLIPVTAPSEPGKYILELDMVQESIAWFNHKGSKTARITAYVENGNYDKTGNCPEAAAFTPIMEMHVLPKERVLRLIEQCKGTTAGVIENNNAPGWIGFTYCVTK